MDSAAGTSRDSAEDKRYEYFAFISYKHEDMRWAKWLQQQIETYRLPAIIRKQAPHLPKQIRPVFRDQTDISTGPLLQNLRQELQDSRYLIVLCSPAAAKSEWVNREVQHFIDMGRAERIIPFVVAGTPNAAKPEEECFPAILRGAEQSMLGVSVPELGKEKAFIKVVAKLLGLKFDQLWDRHRRRQRRQRLVRGLTAGVLLLAAAIGGFASWDYYRTKIAYYADYVQCRGVPQGIGQLSAAQVGRRQLSWKVESSRYRVDRLCSINGSGNVHQATDTEEADRPADRSFHYRDDGALEYTIEVTPTGKEVRKSVYAPDLSIVEFKGGSKGRLQMQAQFLAADSEAISSGADAAETGGRSEIAAWELKYDDLGRVLRRTYLNQSGYPTADANGIYVQEFSYTPAGKAKAIRYLEIGGQPCPTKRGIAGKQYEYDAQGNRTATTWIGATGTPVLDRDGYAICKQKYDADGNYVEETYFGSDEKPRLSKDGYAGEKAVYDGRGNQTSMSYVGADGKPCLIRDGYSAANRTFDERGNRTSSSFFAADGKPCLYKDGYATVRYTFDNRGNQTSTSYFGMDGKPCLHKDGNAAVRRTFDERGNRTSVSYFGADGKPCLLKNGYAQWKTSYDEPGNQVSVSYFGTDGKPCLSKGGVAGWNNQFDNRGNQTSQSYFGTDGKPCTYKDGNAGWTATFDQRGNETSHSYFDTRGKPSEQGGRCRMEYPVRRTRKRGRRVLLRRRRQTLPVQERVCRTEGRV